MELLKLKEIKNVYSIVQLDTSLLVSDKKGILNYHQFDNLTLKFKIEENISVIDTIKHHSNYYFISTRSKLFVQIKNEIVPFLNEFLCVDSLEVKNYIVLYQGDIEYQKNSIYSLTKKQILWSLENISLCVIGDYCFSRKKSNFKARNIETGEVLWDKTITDDFPESTGYKFLTVYNKVLVMAIKDTTLAGYDVDTGELLWSVKKTNNQNLLVDENGKLRGISITSYFETDIQTGVYRRVEFAPYEAFNEPGFFSSERDNFVIIDNHIITTDFYSNRIGAFNMETQQYDWFYTEENATGFPASRPIKYFEPYLCLIDNEDTLHIYELRKQEHV